MLWIGVLLYTLSALGLMALFFMCRKSDKPQNAFSWIPVTYLLYECCAAFFAGLFTVAGIPVNPYTMSALNICLSAVLVLTNRKKAEKWQKYTFNALDIVFAVALTVQVLVIAHCQFGWNFSIRYQTSDPSMHLRWMSQNLRESTAFAESSSLYFASCTNALSAFVAEPFLGKYDLYKVFIVKDVVWLWLSGAMLYAATRKYFSKDKKFGQLSAIILCLVYTGGYPTANMNFGFVYLGMSITLCSLIAFLTQGYQSARGKIFWILLLNIALTGLGSSYTLFVPPVFLAVFLVVLRDFLVRNSDQRGRARFMAYVWRNAAIFLLPSVLTIFYAVVYPKLIGMESALGGMAVEGYIYRNLFSDFIFYLPLALCGVVIGLRGKKMSAEAAMGVFLLLYMAGFFVLMLRGTVSTYYYYKLNFLMAYLCSALAIQAISYLEERIKGTGLCFSLVWVAMYFIFYTGVEIDLSTKNINFAPFSDAHSQMRVYEHSNVTRSTGYGVSEDKLDLFLASDEITGDGPCAYFYGDYTACYWFETITGKMMIVGELPERTYVWWYADGEATLKERFDQGLLGEYILVLKDYPGAERFGEYTVLYENDAGIVYQRDIAAQGDS